MIGGVIVSHGLLAEELIRTAEMIVGRLPNITAVSIDVTTDVETSREQIRQAIELVNHGSGVIVFTDMFGGTPSNLAISLMQAGKVEVIAGINLPMLIRLAKARGCMDIKAASAAARDAGRNYITIASEFLGQDA